MVVMNDDGDDGGSYVCVVGSGRWLRWQWLVVLLVVARGAGFPLVAVQCWRIIVVLD